MSVPPQVPPGARPVPQAGGYTFWVVGDEPARLRDAYHNFLRMPWPASLTLIALGYFMVNVAFAIGYYAVGGVDGVHSGSFFDALVFSVETLGTIGYGVMNPVSKAASSIMIVESITSVIVTALATGLVFTKFARATARVAFSDRMVITPHDGKPTLMFRIGNRRANVIVSAQLRASASFLRITAEGETFYKLYDLKLERDRMAGMRRGWTAMHVIDETSPMFGLSADDLAKADVEIEISLTGLDDVTMQNIHSLHTYTDKEILYGHRFADTIQMLPDGDIVLDLTQFHVIVPDNVPRDSVAA
jgi:inward rectifier potassium channel